MRRILAAVPAPMAVAERQLQLWSTPHGVAKAALAHNATVQAHTIAFTLPDRITLKAAVGGQGLIEKVEAAYPPSQADAFNPPSPGTPPSGPPSPDTVNLVDNIRRLHLAVDRALPLHGYILPMADLHRAAGHSH